MIEAPGSRWRARLVFGFIIPLLAEVIAAVLIVSTESGAYAGPFAYVMVLVMLIIAVPITVFGNLFIVPSGAVGADDYLLRSMILPAVFIAACLIYHTGFWDKSIDPLFPKTVDKFSPAGSGWVDETTNEVFIVVNDYRDSAEDMDAIAQHAADDLARAIRDGSDYAAYNVHYYFVPRADYDALDDAASRANAIAAFRYSGAEGDPVLRVIEQ